MGGANPRPLIRLAVATLLAGSSGCDPGRPPPDEPPRLACAAERAIVLEVSGRAERATGEHATELQALDELAAGDRVSLGEGARLKIHVLQGPAAGTLPAFQGPALVELDPGASAATEIEGDLGRVLAESGRGALSLLDGSADVRTAGATRSVEPDSVLLEGPIETAIRGLRPAFRWRRGSDVRSVTLLIATAAGEAVLRVDGIEDDGISFPPSAPDLAPGSHYLWTLLWPGGHPDGASSWFATLTPEAERDAARALARIDGLPDLNDDARGLLEATLLAGEGYRLFDEAESIVRRLAERNPENARLATWLARLEARRPKGE